MHASPNDLLFIVTLSFPVHSSR